MPPAWALAALGFLLGRVDLFGLVRPFAPAFYAAAGALAPAWRGPVGVTVVLGALSQGAWDAAAAHAVFCFLEGLLVRRWRSGGLRGLAGRFVPVALVVYGILFLARFPGPYGVMLALFQTALGALLAAACHLALQPPAAYGRTWREALEERAPIWSLLAAGAVAGLKGLSAGPVEAGAVASGLLVAAAGWLGGAGTGAVAGTVAGAVQALSGGAPVAAMGAYALSGTLAGVFREWQRYGAAAGAALGAAAAWLASVTGQELAGGAALGSALLVAVPARSAQKMLEALRPGGARRRPAARGDADGRWRALARLLQELGRSCREAAAAVEEPTGDAGLVGRVVSEACAGCQRHRTCWQEGFPAHYRLMSELLARAAREGRVGAETVDELWDRRCLRPREVALVAGCLAEGRRREAGWRRRCGEVRAQVGGHLQALSEVMEDLARDGRPVAPAHGRAAAAAPRLTYKTEVAKLARPGSLISGDSHLVRELPGHVLLLALSDGMGHGYEAASESLVAVELAERLLRAGFDRRTAVRMTNSLIGLRAPEEGFATLDLVLVDLVTGEAEFVKMGAAPSFLVRRHDVQVIKGGALPLGILPAADPDSARLRVGPGDAVVMITDGVLEGAGETQAREEWVRRVIATHAGRGERSLARKLLEEVSANLSGARADDMSVLAVQFWAAGE